jgi:hypothetical protein
MLQRAQIYCEAHMKKVLPELLGHFRAETLPVAHCVLSRMPNIKTYVVKYEHGSIFFYGIHQQNSKTATMMAKLRPHNKTTKTPPMFFTLKGLALESLLLSYSKSIKNKTAFFNTLFVRSPFSETVFS